MNRDNPVLLEKDEELHNLAPVSLHYRDVNDGEDILTIILHLGPLVLMNNIFYSIIIKIESLLEIGELLLGRAFRVNPQYRVGVDLVRKRTQSLGRLLRT